MDMKDAVLESFLLQLRSRFGTRLKRTILFGSRARGEASAESDYDCLLIFSEIFPRDRQEVDELSATALIENGALFSTFLLEEGDLERLRFEPFIMNAQREGVVL